MRLRTLIIVMATISLYACTKQKKGLGVMPSHADTLVDLSKIKHYEDEYKQYFVRSANGEICITDGNYLRQLFNNEYSAQNIEFDLFKAKLCDGTLRISLIDSLKGYYYYDTSFVIDTTIADYYEKHGLNQLLTKYCDKQNQEWHFKATTVRARCTVAYYAWQNGYEYIYGGVSGAEYLIPPADPKRLH